MKSPYLLTLDRILGKMETAPTPEEATLWLDASMQFTKGEWGSPYPTWWAAVALNAFGFDEAEYEAIFKQSIGCTIDAAIPKTPSNTPKTCNNVARSLAVTLLSTAGGYHHPSAKREAA